MSYTCKSLLERVRLTVDERDLIKKESPLLLMVSGGSDSTALAYIALDLVKQGYFSTLAMLHVNHQLRGIASDQDQAFVEKLAQKLDIPLFVCSIDIASERHRTGENEEAIARRERYTAAHEALESFCRHVSAPIADGRILTAHSQDDRVENFYMRSIVGTGPGGFRSMLYANGSIVRPLLDVSREDLRTFIQQREQINEPVVYDEFGELWREDATNAHTDRFRAFVRHQIVPRAKERNPQLLDTLCRVMNLIADEDDMLDEQAASLAKKYINWLVDTNALGPDYSEGCILLPPLAQIPIPLQRRVCLDVLQKILGSDARVETSSVSAVLSGFNEGLPVSGYTTNIQGNLAVSANKKGIRIEPMSVYRARRKRL